MKIDFQLFKRRLRAIVFGPIFLTLLFFSFLIGVDAFQSIFTKDSFTATVAPFMSPLAQALLSSNWVVAIPPIKTAQIPDDWLKLLFSVFSFPFRIIFIFMVFTLAFFISRFSGSMARWGFGLYRQLFQPREMLRKLRMPDMTVFNQEHRETVYHLVAGMISLFVFTVAAVVSLSQFMDAATLAVLGGLITTGIGFGARVMIGDLLAGISNIFEDSFNVGEKIEVVCITGPVSGVVEHVTVRVVFIRAESGELFIIPHGEIRIMRNFSRGNFSIANITFKIAAADLDETLMILDLLKDEAVAELPDLLPPWQIISKAGTLGTTTELTLVCKAPFGKGAELRLKLLDFIQKRLADRNIRPAD
jgi:moderate conductance mechanosensitive channel